MPALANPPRAGLEEEAAGLVGGFGSSLADTLALVGSFVPPAPWLARSSRLLYFRKLSMAAYGIRASRSIIVSVPWIWPGKEAVTYVSRRMRVC